jgi:hypothetical protein
LGNVGSAKAVGTCEMVIVVSETEAGMKVVIEVSKFTDVTRFA